MKLNNKGFALTSIIYMLIVLFLIMMLLILANLAQRKVVLDKIKYDVKTKLNQGGIASEDPDLPYKNINTGVYFTTLEEAFNNAEDNNENTIKILKNVEDESINNPTINNKNIILDLNDNTVVMNNVTITNNSSLTIIGDGTLTTASANDLIKNTGTLNLAQSGTISNTSTGSNQTIQNNGILNKTGTGTISSTTTGYAIRNGTVNIEDGLVTSTGGHALNASNGFTMSGGHVLSKKGMAVYISAGDATLTGGTIEKDSTESGVCFQLSGNGTARLNGGNILISNVNNGSRVLLNYQTGKIIIDGTDIETKGTGNVAVNYSTGIIEILSGNLTGISNTTLSNTALGTINIKGGTIKNIGTGYAIRNTGTGAINVDSGIIEATAQNALHNDVEGPITINGGKITGTRGIASELGPVTVTGGEIIGTTYAGILGADQPITVSGQSTLITGLTRGIYATGNVTVSEGTIIGTDGPGIEVRDGTITLGTNEEPTTVSTTSPSITGSTYGVYSDPGKLNFYDGIIVGQNGTGSSCKNEPNVPTNYTRKITLNGTIETSILENNS